VLGDLARAGARQQRAVVADERRQLVVVQRRAGPARRAVGRIGRHPVVRDLVAVEEAAQLAGAVVAGTRQHQAAFARRCRGDALEPADALGGDRRHLRQDLRMRRGERVELPRRKVHQARRFGRAVAALVRRAEDDRHLAEDLARRALADDALDAVDDLGDLDAAGQHHEQRALVAFVHGVVAGAEPDIAGGLRQARELLGRHRGQNGDDGEVLGRDHEGLSWHGAGRAGTRPRRLGRPKKNGPETRSGP
jgi:hypothetical protein